MSNLQSTVNELESVAATLATTHLRLRSIVNQQADTIQQLQKNIQQQNITIHNLKQENQQLIKLRNTPQANGYPELIEKQIDQIISTIDSSIELLQSSK
ncbi:MAG: hypothetical protein KBT04_08300 [Bacteroidales bacterium]|nr:hypothetical protein [Candidatus Colimorpha onthohippi]